ncbi:NAD(+)/NADH kinase [Aedoeadaptatus nemausensis]|uniref:NAD kinase n=1 Tax=Aedoeadaptatus nemausensis TaxID=2582829 RepID=A0A6V6Y4H6_9FIRM|nr:NAD(+)/NADH kinase [Peptoniphilus nemausensis]CAC9932111.1 NAD(+)/NADH kinase [Peptoniphilus nemausensis]
MSKIINIISNSNFESRRTTKRLIQKLKEHHFNPTTTLSPKAALTITVGGDGAFIKAVNRTKFSSTPIVGINTGHLGFYQEISPDKLDEFIEDYKNNRYHVEQLPILSAEIFTNQKKYYAQAINEIVLKAQNSKVIHMNIFVDRNHLEKFSGDGMLVATPSGSSGYNLSLGGSLVHPEVDAMAMTPLAGISSSSYRSMKSTIVIPGRHVISLVPERRYANSNLVLIDGREHSYSQFKRINIQFSDKRINKLVFENNYWENIKSKFL